MQKEEVVNIINIMYLTDEYLYIGNKKNKNIKKILIPRNIVINGKVAQVEKFISFLEKVIKDNNLNNSLIPSNIKIIVGPKYTNAEIFLLKNIMQKLNFHKIIIESESKYYKLNQEKAFLNVLNNYSLLTYINIYAKKESFLIPNDFFCITENKDNLAFFLQFIKNKIRDKDLYLFGNGVNMDLIYQNFEKKYHNKTYLFANNDTFIIDNVINL